jgi:flagellar biosynthetic protein FliO
VAAAVVVVLLGVLIAVLPGRTASGTGEPARAEPGMGGMALKVMASVAVLLGLLYAGVYGMKRFSTRNRSALDPDAITVLHRRHLAPKRTIYVVKVGGKVMVVGVTDTNINHLADLTPEDLEGMKTAEESGGKDFKKHFLAFGFGLRDR